MFYRLLTSVLPSSFATQNEYHHVQLVLFQCYGCLVGSIIVVASWLGCTGALRSFL